ncbi:MAG: methylenetetrahydrofolate reductase [NAD(P)H] [Rhizobiales bacterium]|nr:methylenetetrahydrofolate reductase [NAD(P)H] [Hyphomicrobiales bacterium]NRB14013.1 methylenetetrahydrofolate reductase [NAD(P)H] [Hyphomicrobiales bacterium]
MSDKLNLSFEFFPPANEKMQEKLWVCVKRLEEIKPRFVSVTYGAGGSTRERTHKIVTHLAQNTSMIPAAHLTCVDASRDEIDQIVQKYWDDGVRHIVALRGDPQAGIGEKYTPRADGYANAEALVHGIKKIGDFEISVAAYPEQHPESGSLKADMDNLKAKIDAGASQAITQMFFDNDLYYRFLDECEKANINVPIIPGIAPVINFKGTKNFAKKCGTTIPAWLDKRFAGLDDDEDTRRLVAASVVVEQVRDLYAHGVRDYHIYTMNRAELTYAISHQLENIG